MSDVLTDTSAAAMARAFEQNYEACLSGLVAGTGTVARDDELTIGVSQLPMRAFNGVFRARLRSERTPAEIAALVASTLRRFAKADRALRWFAGPSTLPSDLGTYLVAAGMSALGDHPAMGMSLDALPDEPPPDLRIERVTRMEDAQTWALLSVDGFDRSASGQEAARLLARPVLAAPGQQIYLGWQGDQAIATCAACYAAGVVGLYSIATLPSARRRGVGRAMTLAALRAARDRGYHIAVLESSELGEPVYARIGFREVCRLPGYVWSPPAA